MLSLLPWGPLDSTHALHSSSHCAEVIVNAPEQCAKCFLLPPDLQVMPTLQRLYPDLYGDECVLFRGNLDSVFDGWNMSAVLALVNLLDSQLVRDTPLGM